MVGRMPMKTDQQSHDRQPRSNDQLFRWTPFLLRGREVIGLDVSDDQAVLAEEERFFVVTSGVQAAKRLGFKAPSARQTRFTRPRRPRRGV